MQFIHHKHYIPWFFSGNGIVSLSLLSRFRISRISLWKQVNTDSAELFCGGMNYSELTTGEKRSTCCINRNKCQNERSRCTSLCFRYRFPPATAPAESRWGRKTVPPGWGRRSFHPPWSPPSAQSPSLQVPTETADNSHTFSQSNKALFWFDSYMNPLILKIQRIWIQAHPGCPCGPH